MTCEKFLMTKIRLWVHTQSSKNSTPPGSGKTVGQIGIFHQTKEAAKSRDGNLTCHMSITEDAVVESQWRFNS